jgi:hypothetical protein
MIKFDGNRAWKQATTSMGAHRELLLALAGVFFFLPSFALIMLIKQPQVPPGASPEAVLATLEPFVAAIAPWMIIGSVVQALGQLTLLELFGRGGRSTVGEALRKGGIGLLTYVVVQLLTGFMMTAVLFLALALGSVISPVLGLALAVYLVCQAYARLMTAGAVIVLERQMNPFVALVRAVSLTRGNGFRLGNFLFLLLIAFFVGFLVLTIVVGILAALTMGEGRAAEIVTGFFSSAVTALAVAWFAAITAAVYRQLTGAAPQEVRAPFE